MSTWKKIQHFFKTDLGVLILLGLMNILLHTLLNGRYGFHRDELGMLDNARHLAWGFVDYPPVTPFLVRLAYELFGASAAGLRFFSAVVVGTVMVLTGLMARDLGGGRKAQVLAALAAGIAPYALYAGSLFMYVTFDYLWWVLAAFLLIRLLKTEDPRWWLGIGAAIGLGMMTKYTMGFLVAGIVAGVVLTRVRRFLKSPWLWAGVGMSVLIFLPNLLWQVQHDFISLDFLREIHARDVSIGRGDSYLSEQVWACTNLVTVPLWLTGLFVYLFAPFAKPFRALAWLYLIPFGLFLYLRGRSYYLIPAYPMLLASGAVAWEMGVERCAPAWKRLAQGITWALVALGGLAMSVLVLPIAPQGSELWRKVISINSELKEQVGWPELVQSVAHVYSDIPDQEKSTTQILTGNYGEAGAINLYGPEYGLPEAISGMNSYWLRGFGDSPPETVIVLGLDDARIFSFFEECGVEGTITNAEGILNEEAARHSRIYVCRGLRKPWPIIWEYLQDFG
jgi:4-amino-4-deoxy-L-arabinose transferase-like glycosyltransferase